MTTCTGVPSKDLQCDENFNQAKCALLVWNTQLHIHNSSSVSKTSILNTVPRILSSNVHQEIDDGNYRMGGGSVISRVEIDPSPGECKTPPAECKNG